MSLTLTPAGERILAALSSQLAHEYDQLTPLNEGGTALVFRCVKKSISQPRVLKVLKLDLGKVSVTLKTGETVTRDFPSLFRTEIQRVLAVSHANVMKLYDAGTVTVDDQELPWYIMEHLSRPDDLDVYLEKRLSGGTLTRDEFIAILQRIVHGVAALHQAGIAHLDIKPGNILVGENGEVRVTDLGFAKSLTDLADETRPPSTLVIADRRFMAPRLLQLLSGQDARYQSGADTVRTTAVAIPRAELFASALAFDLVSLGKTIRYVVEQLGSRLAATVDDTTIAFIRASSKRLEDADSHEAGKYLAIGELRNDLRKLEPDFSVLGLAAELNPLHPAAIRLAGETDMPATARLLHLVDSAPLQRLRSVRQLGLTHLVYPGAMHTRFEHSLGVTSMVSRYAAALWHGPHSQAFRGSVGPAEIGALLLAALFHDIGHYPMAHAFEEVEPHNLSAFKHDLITQRLLLGQDQTPDIGWDRSETENYILKHWGISLVDVASVLKGEAPKPQGTEPAPKTHIRMDLLQMLHSILDGQIDADKADYLIRDSTHTGNPYGSAIDLAKMLQNITATYVNQPIGVSNKGLRSVERLYINRYHMFVTVYWHHTKRAAERMVTEALRIIRAKSTQDEFREWFYGNAFDCNDEQLLGRIATKLASDTLAGDLINPLLTSGRNRGNIYKRLVEISEEENNSQVRQTHEYVLEFFDGYMGGGPVSERQYRYLDAWLRKEVLTLAGKGFSAHHVLLDVPDPRPTKPAYLMVTDGRGSPVPAADQSSIFRHYADDWKKQARKVRLFVAADLYVKLADSREKVKAILIDAATMVKLRPTLIQKDIDELWTEIDKLTRT
jgi:HD superfamily phosphohydrolase